MTTKPMLGAHMKPDSDIYQRPTMVEPVEWMLVYLHWVEN